MDMRLSYLQAMLMLVKTNLEAIKATLPQMIGFLTLIMNIWTMSRLSRIGARAPRSCWKKKDYHELPSFAFICMLVCFVFVRDIHCVWLDCNFCCMIYSMLL